MTCCVVPPGGSLSGHGAKALSAPVASTGTQRDWASARLGFSATGTQRDRDSAPPGLSATGTQYDCGWVKKPDGSYFFLTVAKRVLFALK